MVYQNFSPLLESERADIFRDVEREVAQMLQLNLLQTFHNSAAFSEVGCVGRRRADADVGWWMCT